ncbi:hypothetical protein SKAU_G00356310 [Synaphobranchus kaupii]|uniref:Uncharacterized protein n=1 Tax=Synaphobranchus kaupii TaxID=118154 RepID=A0A9Q1EHH2_SYNKA|nr:hypothetical protein SKAU_G00356310 [Synaphobranchus kaupii]
MEVKQSADSVAAPRAAQTRAGCGPGRRDPGAWTAPAAGVILIHGGGGGVGGSSPALSEREGATAIHNCHFNELQLSVAPSAGLRRAKWNTRSRGRPHSRARGRKHCPRRCSATVPEAQRFSPQ